MRCAAAWAVALAHHDAARGFAQEVALATITSHVLGTATAIPKRRRTINSPPMRDWPAGIVEEVEYPNPQPGAHKFLPRGWL